MAYVRPLATTDTWLHQSGRFYIMTTDLHNRRITLRWGSSFFFNYGRKVVKTFNERHEALEYSTDVMTRRNAMNGWKHVLRGA